MSDAPVKLHYRRFQDSIAESVDDEFVIYNPEEGTFFQLNSAGEVIWEELTHWATLEDLASSLEAAFDVPKEQAAKDSATFIEAMAARHLVETSQR